jgi:hypothetical protein
VLARSSFGKDGVTSRAATARVVSRCLVFTPKALYSTAPPVCRACRQAGISAGSAGGSPRHPGKPTRCADAVLRHEAQMRPGAVYGTQGGARYRVLTLGCWIQRLRRKNQDRATRVETTGKKASNDKQASNGKQTTWPGPVQRPVRPLVTRSQFIFITSVSINSPSRTMTYPSLPINRSHSSW